MQMSKGGVWGPLRRAPAIFKKERRMRSSFIKKRIKIVNMKKFNGSLIYLLIVAILGVFVFMGCPAVSTTPAGDTTPPTVIATFPLNIATSVAMNTIITATFSEAMDPATIIAANFTVMEGANPVTGIVTYDLPTKTATFAPTVNLIGSSTVYTATITTGVKDTDGNAMSAARIWTFTTTVMGLGPAPVLLGTAGGYVILAKSTITNVPTSAITGNIGLSPAATSFITGFSLTALTGAALSPQVIGIVYAADMSSPTPANLTAAVSAMQAAYTDAAGRVSPNFTNEGAAGSIGGLTLAPGLHKWTTAVTIPSNVTINGAANDIWIFQITGTLTQSSGIQIVLTGGAQAKNIFWQVSGAVSIGTTAHFEGVILGQSSITLGTSATMNGNALAQTAVILDKNTITKAL
jgi:hypothetical protein